MSHNKIKLMADKVSIRGPRVDGSWVVSFELGEYQKDEIAKLLSMRDDEQIQVSVAQ